MKIAHEPGVAVLMSCNRFSVDLAQRVDRQELNVALHVVRVVRVRTFRCIMVHLKFDVWFRGHTSQYFNCTPVVLSAIS